MKRKYYTPAMQDSANKAYNCELHGRKTNQPKLIELAAKAYEMIDAMWKANGEIWIIED